jgi:hypothetical protein
LEFLAGFARVRETVARVSISNFRKQMRTKIPIVRTVTPRLATISLRCFLFTEIREMGQSCFKQVAACLEGLRIGHAFAKRKQRAIQRAQLTGVQAGHLGLESKVLPGRAPRWQTKKAWLYEASVADDRGEIPSASHDIAIPTDLIRALSQNSEEEPSDAVWQELKRPRKSELWQARFPFT